MRVLVVPSADRARGALEAALAARGHDVAIAKAPWARPSKRREIALAADVARRALTSRFDIAYVEGSHRTSAVTAALKAARVPYVLGVAAAPLEAVQIPANGSTMALAKPRLPITVELARQAVRLSMRGAADTIAFDRNIADHLFEETGVSGTKIAPEAIDLSRLPLGSRAEARRALGLEGRHVVALVADLDADLPYEALLFAHRTLAGTALLVVGDGPGASSIAGMAAATRPSAPVLHLGPKTEGTLVASICAADVGLSLGRRTADPIAKRYAALGRRQVLFDVPEARDLAALYPTHDTVFVAEENPESIAAAIRRATDVEHDEGPLPFWAVDAARRGLKRSRAEVLAEHLESCA